MFVPINCSTNKLHNDLWSANCFYKHFENCSRIRVYFQRPEKRQSQLFKHNWHFPIFRRNSLSVCSTSELFSNVSIQFWPLTSQLIIFISSLSLTLTITSSLLRQKRILKMRRCILNLIKNWMVHLPSRRIPIFRHFLRRQYWHWFRWCWSMGQFLLPRHEYVKLRRTDRLKNDLQPKKNNVRN